MCVHLGLNNAHMLQVNTEITLYTQRQQYVKVARLPLVPAVRLLDGSGMQDSTPIMVWPSFDEIITREGLLIIFTCC